MRRAFEGAPGEQILKACEHQGMLGLAPYDSGARSIYARKPVKSLADMKGLKIRVQQSDLWVAVGVRDAGHLGMESIVALLPRGAQRVTEGLIHLCVPGFAVLMGLAGWAWLTLKWNEPKPMLGVPEGLDFLPLVISGVLIVLFCVEHLIALWRGRAVEEAGV